MLCECYIKECGEHVKRLNFSVNMSSAKLVWLTENCVNVTELSLPPSIAIRGDCMHNDALGEIGVKTLIHLEICTDLKKLYNNYVLRLIDLFSFGIQRMGK